MLFDVKMDYTRKAHLVAGGHVTDPSDVSSYSSAISRESVRGLKICCHKAYNRVRAWPHLQVEYDGYSGE